MKTFKYVFKGVLDMKKDVSYIFETLPQYSIIKTKHPHVIEKLEPLWGTYQFEYEIERLMIDDRGGIRKGFSLDVFACLVELHQLHRNLPKKLDL